MRTCYARINEILQQPASPNLDSDGQESVFYGVETLSNTVGSVCWDNIITLWLNDRQRVKVFKTMTGSLIFFSNLRNLRNRPNSKYDMPIGNCQAIKKALQIASLTLGFNTLGRARPWFVTLRWADGHGFHRGFSKHYGPFQTPLHSCAEPK